MVKAFDFLSSLIYSPTLNVTFDEGGKGKPTIVFLHGLAATSATWEPIRNKIDRTKHRIIAMDLLGFGDSKSPKNCQFTVQEHTKYVRNTLNKLGVKKPFKLVGHSMGSIISVHYAANWPKELHAVYLISPPLYITDNRLTTARAKRETKILFKAYEYFRGNKSFTVKNAQRLRKVLRIDDGIDVTDSNWDAFQSSLLNTIENQNTYEEIKKSRTQFFLIYGNFDEFTIKDNLDRVSELANVHRTIVKGVDHVVGNKLSEEIAKTLITT